MESLKNRMKVRELLVFSEMQEICLKELKLHECSHLVGKIDVDSSTAIASYSSYNHRIKFNMQGLTSSAFDFANELITNEGLYKKNRNIYANVLILITIYHELKHVFQDYKLNMGGYDSLEFDMMTLSYLMVNLLSNENYRENYLFLPSERDAELTAWVDALKIIESINLKPKELFEFQKAFIVLALKGYEFSERVISRGFFPGPFESVLENYSSKQYEIYKEKINKSLETHSTFDRIRLGLPITIDEVDKYAEILKSGKPVDIEKMIVKNM